MKSELTSTDFGTFLFVFFVISFFLTNSCNETSMILRAASRTFTHILTSQSSSKYGKNVLLACERAREMER